MVLLKSQILFKRKKGSAESQRKKIERKRERERELSLWVIHDALRYNIWFNILIDSFKILI